MTEHTHVSRPVLSVAFPTLGAQWNCKVMLQCCWLTLNLYQRLLYLLNCCGKRWRKWTSGDFSFFIKVYFVDKCSCKDDESESEWHVAKGQDSNPGRLQWGQSLCRWDACSTNWAKQPPVWGLFWFYWPSGKHKPDKALLCVNFYSSSCQNFCHRLYCLRES